MSSLMGDLFREWAGRHLGNADEHNDEICRLEQAFDQMRGFRDQALADLTAALEQRDKAQQHQAATAERLDVLFLEIHKLAVDFHALNVGAKPPSGRPLTWAGDVEAALRAILDKAVI